MTSFADVDALIIPPNAVTAWGSSVARASERTENPQGNVIVTTTDATARAGERTLTWHCVTRAELNALTTFLDARLGQVASCWIPTYQRDLEVTLIFGSGAWLVDVGTIELAATFAALVNDERAWQYWTAIAPGTARYFTGRSYAGDNLDGTVTIQNIPFGPIDVNGPWGVTSAAGALFSRLVLSRMTSSDYHISYVTGSVATVTAEFIEVADAEDAYPHL